MPLFPQSGVMPNIGNLIPNQTNQFPGMSINIPSMLQQPTNTPNPVLVGVHGLDSVKQFPFKPNQTLAFHDLDADFEYVVNTDVNNQPAFKILEFNEITEEEYRAKYSKAINAGNVVLTSDEYETLLKRLDKLEKEVSENAKQSVQYDRKRANADRANESTNAAAKSSIGSEDTANLPALKI